MRVLTTREVIRATGRTRIVRLDLGREPFQFKAGQAIIAGLHDAAIKKPYSIACSPRQAAEANAIELLVQIDDSDPENPHLERLTPGTAVDVEGPLGSFALPSSDTDDDVLLVAGGTGIAPLRAMLWDVIERRPTRHMSMIYSARSADEIAYEEELQTLAQTSRLHLHVTLTRDGREQWLGPRGRIDLPLLNAVLRTSATDCVVCGPPAMVNDVTVLLLRAGVPPERIVREGLGA